MEEVKRIFKPEFINRIDEMLVFRMLNKEDMKKIVALMTKNLVERCKTQMDIQLVIRDTAKSYVVEKAYDPKFGARPLRRMIQIEIEDKLAEEILSGAVKKGDTVAIGTKNKRIHFSGKCESE